MFPGAGGLYVYLKNAFGDRVGFLFGWYILLCTNCGAIAGLSLVCSEHVDQLIPLGGESGRLIFALGIMVIVTVLNVFGAKLGEYFGSFFTMTKIVGIAFLVFVGLFFSASPEQMAVHDAAFLSPPSGATNMISAFAAAFVGVLWSYGGWQHASFLSGETQNPQRTIPRATYAAVIIIGAFYAITVWAFVVAVGPDQVATVAQKTLAGEGNMLLDTTGDMLGTVGRDIVNVLLLSSLFACVLSFHNVIARYQFVLAGKGLLPARLATVHDDHESPSFSSLVQTATAAIIVAVLAILGIDPLVGVFGSMAGVAMVGMVLLMLTTSVAVLAFFLRNRELGTDHLWTTRIAPALAVLGLLGSLWLVLSNFTLVTGGSATLPATQSLRLAREGDGSFSFHIQPRA